MQNRSSILREFTTRDSQGKLAQHFLVGPSMWGYVYRRENAPVWVRLVPIEDLYTQQKRAAISAFKDKPRQPQVAPIVETRQLDLHGRIFFMIGYEIDPDDTWQNIIAQADPATRLAAAARILESLPKWWSMTYAGIIPMPADILFVQQTPFLLLLPFQGWPRLESLFEEPDRIRYIAPEVLRGRQSLIWGQNIDLYAVGAAILECLNTSDADLPAETLMVKAAMGALHDRVRGNGKLPFWTSHVPRIRTLQERIYQSVSADLKVRSQIDPARLAETINADIDYLNPETVIAEFRSSGRFSEAFALLKDILLTESTYELLLLGGRIAGEDLDQPMEAIGLCDRAIGKEPGRPDAYREQLKILLENTVHTTVLYLMENPEDINGILEKIDFMVQRNFAAITLSDKLEFLIEVGNYLIGRGHYQQCARIVYNFLYDGKIYLWWEFPRTLLYAEALIGMGRLEEGKNYLSGIKEKLRKAHIEARFPPELIHEWGSTLSRLEMLIHEKS